jgi:hypothetical protein
VRGWLAVAAIACVAAACSLGALDGFSGGTTGVTDAGSEPSAETDTSTGDTGGGATDSATDGGAKTFCASLTDPALLCVDFEDGLPLGFQTKAVSSTANVDGQGKDGTKGLTVTVPSNAPTSAEACVHIALPGPRTKLVVEADVRFSVVGSANFDILNLYSGTDRELGVSVTSTALQIEEERAIDGGIELTTAATAMVKNTFQRLRFVVTTDGDAARAELLVDGNSVATHNAIATNANGALTLQIGDCTLVGAKGWTAHYDNVVVIETKN